MIVGLRPTSDDVAQSHNDTTRSMATAVLVGGSQQLPTPQHQYQQQTGVGVGGSPMTTTRRFPNILFTHADLAIYLDRAVATRELDLSGGQLGATDDVAFIAERVVSQRMDGFRALTFSHCQLTPDGLDLLVRVALEQAALEAFVVGGNRLPKAAGHGLAKLLGGRGQLRSLDAQHNALGDVGLASLAGAFSSDLTSLQLGPTAGAGAANAAPPPLLALSRLTLHTLDLSGNGIGDLGADTLCRCAPPCLAFSLLLSP